MSWRILNGQIEPDLDRFEEADRDAITTELMDWVEGGPPMRNRRDLAGIDAYEDRLDCGFDVTYIVDEAIPYAAILRIRRAI